VDELRPHQPHLRNLNQWYRDFVTREGNSIKTLSFYEMKPLPRVGLVVEPGDADPGVPHAELHPLDDNHNSICKPSTKSSSIYQRVLAFVDLDCFRRSPSSGHRAGADGFAGQGSEQHTEEDPSELYPTSSDSSERGGVAVATGAGLVPLEITLNEDY